MSGYSVVVGHRLRTLRGGIVSTYNQKLGFQDGCKASERGYRIRGTTLPPKRGSGVEINFGKALAMSFCSAMITTGSAGSATMFWSFP